MSLQVTIIWDQKLVLNNNYSSIIYMQVLHRYIDTFIIPLMYLDLIKIQYLVYSATYFT